MYARLFLLFLLIGCSRGETGDNVLATLGQRRFLERDFEQYVNKAYPQKQRDAVLRAGDERKRVLDDFLDDIALGAKAEQAGLDSDPRFEQAVRLMEIKLLSRRMTEQHRDKILKESDVTDTAVRAYYEAHKHLYMEEPHFTAHQLVVYVKGNPAFPEKGRRDKEAREQATRALKALQAGKGWEEVASTYSDESTTHRKGGLIRDGRFGHFAPEVEVAVRTQQIGTPGPVFKSVFGYHIVQVEARVLEKSPKPFEQLAKNIEERLFNERSTQAAEAVIAPIRDEMGLEVTDAGRREGPLLDRAVADDSEILATLGEQKIRESDFRWFLKDALMPSQRSAYARPGARQAMLRSYLDMLVLAAKARRIGLDRRPEFIKERDAMKRSLMVEFLQARDNAGPLQQCGGTPLDRQAAEDAYLTELRTEVGLMIVSD